MDYCCKICPSCHCASGPVHYAFITPGENGPWERVPCGRKYIPVMVQVCPQTRINKEKSPSLSAEGFGPSGESRTHGLLNPILCDEWYGRTHRQKSAETSHFQGFLFPRFWYETGSFITHSLRPPDGEILQAHFGTATRLFPVRAKERYGLENRRLELSSQPKTDVPL